MKIVVIGGTGLIGSKVVEILRGRGQQVVVAAPETGVDILTGDGLAEALAGADTVVDLSNSPSFADQAVMDFFQTAGRNIAAAEAAAGVRHHIALSVVGTERLQDSGYMRAKLAQEALIKGSGIPYTLVHACQFFEFLRGIANGATEGSMVRLPHARFQPMAARDVSAAVAETALAAPLNAMFEIGGPDIFRMDELVARVLQYDKDPRRVVADPEALYFGARLDDTSLVPGPGARLGATGFDWWLENVPPPPSVKPPQPAQPAHA
jgi:uncharacterized protein YbjT (DUF2867 family)